MWQLTSPNLPAIAASLDDISGAPLAQLAAGFHAASIATIDLQSQQPGIHSTAPTITTSVTVPQGVSGVSAITVSNLSSITIITSGTSTFTPAADPTNPQPGEFVYANGQATIYTDSTHALTPGLSAQIVGASNASVATDYVSPSIAEVFYGLPVVGQVAWSCSLEQHPSGSLSLHCLQNAIGSVRSRFAKGTELEFAGIGFSVANYKEKLLSLSDYPGGAYEVSISLTGKWARSEYNRSVPYRPGVIQNAAAPYQDSDCVLGGSGSTTPATSAAAVPVQSLASFAGASFQPGGGSNWSVAVPKDAPQNATVNWVQEATALMRPNGCLVAYWNPSAVVAQSATGGSSWSYTVPAVEITVQGDTEHSGSIYGYAAEYPNVQLTGTFATVAASTQTEDTHGNRDLNQMPRWKPRQPKRVTLTSGSKDPTLPPQNVTAFKTVSLAWNNSGPTKTLRSTTTEDGSPILEEEWIYGIAATSQQINASAASLWGVVQYKRTEHLYDPTTGYALGSNTTGFALRPYKNETDALEATSDTQGLYAFQKIPIVGKTRSRFNLFSDYYSDAGNVQGAYVTYKECLRDGSSAIRAKLDPTFVPAALEVEQLTYNNSFAHMANPDSTSSSPLPDLTTGEEHLNHTVKQISAATATVYQTPNGSSLTIQDDTGGNEFDSYTEWRIEDSSQGAGFSDKAVRETFEQYEGRPGTAARKPPILEKEQPETKGNSPAASTAQDAQKYEYRLCTPGYSSASPSGGSVSFDRARTLTEATLAAQTDLKLKDIQSSVQIECSVPFNPWIRPFDRVGLSAGKDGYQCRVYSFSNTLLIQGQLNSYPLLSAPEGTKLQCGLDRTIPVSVQQRTLPLPPKPPTQQVSLFLNPITDHLSIGDLFPVNFTSRGNY